MCAHVGVCMYYAPLKFDFLLTLSLQSQITYSKQSFSMLPADGATLSVLPVFFLHPTVTTTYPKLLAFSLQICAALTQIYNNIFFRLIES